MRSCKEGTLKADLHSSFPECIEQKYKLVKIDLLTDLDKSLNCPPAALSQGISCNFVKNIVLTCLLDSVYKLVTREWWSARHHVGPRL